MFILLIAGAALALVVYIIVVYERRLAALRAKTDRTGALEKARQARAQKKKLAKEQILVFVKKHDQVSSDQIRSHLDVSESTIVRYLTELTKEKRLTPHKTDDLVLYGITDKR